MGEIGQKMPRGSVPRSRPSCHGNSASPFRLGRRRRAVQALSSYTPDPRSSQASTVLTSGRGCHSGPTTPLLQTRTTAKSNPCMRRDRLGPLLPPLPPPSGTQDSVQSRVSLKSQLGPHADSCRHTRTHLSRYSSNAFRPPTVHLRTLRSPSSLLSPGAVHPVISSVDI